MIKMHSQPQHPDQRREYWKTESEQESEENVLLFFNRVRECKICERSDEHRHKGQKQDAENEITNQLLFTNGQKLNAPDNHIYDEEKDHYAISPLWRLYTLGACRIVF